MLHTSGSSVRISAESHRSLASVALDEGGMHPPRPIGCLARALGPWPSGSLAPGLARPPPSPPVHGAHGAPGCSGDLSALAEPPLCTAMCRVVPRSRLQAPRRPAKLLRVDFKCTAWFIVFFPKTQSLGFSLKRTRGVWGGERQGGT